MANGYRRKGRGYLGGKMNISNFYFNRNSSHFIHQKMVNHSDIISALTQRSYFLAKKKISFEYDQSFSQLAIQLRNLNGGIA